MSRATVAVLRTRPESVVEDYGRLMRLAGYDRVLPRDGQLLLKLNLSWTKYFPACSTQPWQLDGVLNTLVDVMAVLGAHRLLQAEAVRRRRERVLAKASGFTLVGLGLYVAASRRQAILE